MSRTGDRVIEDVVIRQATQWHVRHGEGALSPDEKTAFAEWLRRSPQHVRSYLQLAQFQGLLRDAVRAPTGELPLQSHTSNVLALERASPAAWTNGYESNAPARRSRAKSALAACAALTVCGTALWLLGPFAFGVSKDVITVPHGDQRTITLADGSIVHLNSQSAVRVRYSKHERLIELNQGQALFSVARDAARPFRVRVRETDVVALGTEFDIYRKESGLTVTVVDGKVEVRSPSQPIAVAERGVRDASLQKSSAPARGTLQLQAGEQLRLEPSIAVPKAEAVDVRVATAWLRREILFDEQRLEDVAVEFNRYIPTPISLEDPRVRERRVSGIFNAYDAESFLAFLRQYDIEIEHGERAIRVRSRKP